MLVVVVLDGNSEIGGGGSVGGSERSMVVGILGWWYWVMCGGLKGGD